MSDINIELNGADRTASTEANAASAAQDVDTSEEDELFDYNDEDQVEAAQRRAGCDIPVVGRWQHQWGW